MKKIFGFIALTLLSLVSYGQQFYGEKITETGAIRTSEFVEKMKGADSLEVKLSGVVVASCKAKGCWMDVDLGNGKMMKVTFKDYGFFVPKGLSKADATIQGVARKETMSLETLKHYAKDAGKSQAEIDAIKAPETTITFEAIGVIIKDAK